MSTAVQSRLTLPSQHELAARGLSQACVHLTHSEAVDSFKKQVVYVVHVGRGNCVENWRQVGCPAGDLAALEARFFILLRQYAQWNHAPVSKDVFPSRSSLT